tara:strand:+ start:360 stop:461 length:102 start_codon:yes stop_codon:yes gene_type:complete
MDGIEEELLIVCRGESIVKSHVLGAMDPGHISE